MHKSFFESEAELYNSAIIIESELMQNEFLPPSLITEGFFKNLLDKLTISLNIYLYAFPS